MSDNEDLLGDDLGDQSLADYNLGNEEEDQLLADDYESGAPQNVPVSIGDGYTEAVELVPSDYSRHEIQYAPPPVQYEPVGIEAECVVPNITVEVTNRPPHAYAPIDPPHYEIEHAVPAPIPAGPVESPQIVPSEGSIAVPNGSEPGRERFITERPVGAHRLPQVRDIPDSLDKVVIPRGYPRGRTTWRAAHFNPRYSHPYRRNNVTRGNFNQRYSFPPPQQVMRPNIPPQIIRQEIRQEIIRQEIIRPEIRPEIIRPEIRPEVLRPGPPPQMIRPDMRMEIRPEMRLDIRPDLMPPGVQNEMILPEMRPNMPRMGPEISPERPILPDMSFRHQMERPPFQPHQRFQYRPEERQMFLPMRPSFERPMYPFPRQFNPRFGPPVREIVANSSQIPQVTIRQMPDKLPGKEPEVRMLPVPLPPHIPPAGLAGKKVLINPHFKGNFQPPVEGLPAYIPTRIQKSPPRSPPNLGPIKDIDDAAERFIAEQRNALARAATRKFPRRSPQRYIENTTIEIENELASRPVRRRSEDDLLRRQEEFINANRAGLRRRMRSPSPPGTARRSPSPPPVRRARPDPPRHQDPEESEYKRRVREQESLRERVLRAKEVRRRKNAVALHKQVQDREREVQDKIPPPKEKDIQPVQPTTKDKEPVKDQADNPTSTEETKPDTTRKTPERKSPEKEKVVEKIVEKSPVKAKDDEVNSTCEGPTPVEGGTPPWGSEDDDLDMILGDIDGILSDEDDTGRFKDKPDPKTEPPKPKAKPMADLRSKLPPKPSVDSKPLRQKIIFAREKEQREKKERTPPLRRLLVSSSKPDDTESPDKKPNNKPKQPLESSTNRSRQRIIFENKDKQAEKEKEKPDKTPPFSNRRVILQRKPTKDKSIFSRMDPPDRSHANPPHNIFSRAVRTAIGDHKIVVKKDEPQIEYESDSDIDEDRLLNEEIGNTALVSNLPHGMTDTRLKTLAGNEVQSLTLDKEERTANITFHTTVAAETFKKKFNNKMVAASRLSVALR